MYLKEQEQKSKGSNMPVVTSTDAEWHCLSLKPTGVTLCKSPSATLCKSLV